MCQRGLALINGVLDYVLIYGKLGIPPMGIRGAAPATVIAWTLASLMYIAALLMHRERKHYALGTAWRFDRALFARLMRFGLPNGFQLLIDVSVWTLFVQMIGSLGPEHLAATSLAFNLNSLAFIPILGMGTAVVTLTGQRIGEGRPELAVRTTRLAFALSMAYIAVFSAIYLFAPRLILLPYSLSEQTTNYPALEEQVVELLRYVAVYALFDAMAIVFSSATRGAGDTRFALLFSFVSGLVLLILPTWTARYLGYSSLTIPWVAVTVFIVFVGLGYLWRFEQGRWKSMRVIELVARQGSDAGTDLPAQEALSKS